MNPVSDVDTGFYFNTTLSFTEISDPSNKNMLFGLALFKNSNSSP